MERKLLIEEAFLQLRVALLEDDVLVEYRTEELQGKMRAGSVYKGRVCDILPGMQAAFVDIGEDKNAYLAVKDVLDAQNKTIGQALRPGQEVLVQVLREGDDHKGARVSMYLALPGHLMVLRPFETGVGVSKRIADERERSRLKNLVRAHCPKDLGVVLRTAAAGQTEETLAQALDEARERWESLKRQAAQKSAPCLLRAENDLLEKSLRDLMGENLCQIVVSGGEAYARAQRLVGQIAPEYLSRLCRYDGGIPLFDLYNLEKELHTALHTRVELKSGGFLRIQQTEALTVIDVNSGAFVGQKRLEQTALAVNLEAAGEVARQLRLRDAGGAVIVDFIDLQEQSSRQRLLDELFRAVQKDRTPVIVHGLTRLGLVELTRKRVRQPLSFDLMQSCPLCRGEGLVLRSEELLRRGLREAKREGTGLCVRAELFELAKELANGSGVPVRCAAGQQAAYELEAKEGGGLPAPELS